MINNAELNNTVVGVMAAALTAAAIVSLGKKLRRNNFPRPKLAILVFPDGAEKCSTTGGLEPNAITIRYRNGLEKLAFLKNNVAKQLGSKDVRLFVQATKEEITNDSELKSALLSKGKDHGLTAVVLISTQNGKSLSPEAASGEPLQHFS